MWIRLPERSIHRVLRPTLTTTIPGDLGAARDAAGYAPISDYAFLSDCRSSALVSTDGSIDWLCWPRFDSPAIFAALLDSQRGGTWRIRPVGDVAVERRYLPQTNVVETTFTTSAGVVRLTDWLHVGARQAMCRRLEGVSGTVEVEIVCDPRPNYGEHGPVAWERRLGWLVCELPDGDTIVADGVQGTCERRTIAEGDVHGFSLTLNRPGPSDLTNSLDRTVAHWREWCAGLHLPPARAEIVERSALTLKGLQYQPSGAIIAAATTSLPECIGGTRNWDYRYSWLRDATLTLSALGRVGKVDEAQSWLDWLKMISLASGVEDLQIMYGVGGEPDLPEAELSHLEGYRASAPVRTGNGAATQRQIDTYGEVADALWMMRLRSDEPMNPHRWRLMRALANRTLREWREPDEGIWEVRGEPAHFVLSKVMCWVALDRAIALAELDGYDDANLPQWRAERDELRAEILDRGFDSGARLVHPVLRLRHARRVEPHARPGRLHRPGRRPVRRHRPRDAGAPHARRPRGPLRRGAHRRRLRRRGRGHVRDLHALAVQRAAADRRPPRRAGALRPRRRLRERPRTAGGGAHARGRAARQLPPGLHPHRADPLRVRAAGRGGAGRHTLIGASAFWARPGG